MASMTIQALLKNENINQRIDLIKIIRTGIPNSELERIKSFTTLDDNELSNILPISKRQLIRYSPSHILNKEITSHLIQLVELFQKGYRLFGTDKFNNWIRTNNKVLRNSKPIEIMDSSIGIELIEDIIGRIEHGVYS